MTDLGPGTDGACALSLPGGEGGLGREPEPGGVNYVRAWHIPTPARSCGATRPSGEGEASQIPRLRSQPIAEIGATIPSRAGMM